MVKREDDPYAITYTQLYASLFTYFARASARPAKAIATAAGCSEGYLSLIAKAERLPTLDKTRDFDRALNAEGCLFEVRRLIERLQTQTAQKHRLGSGPPSDDAEEGDEVERRALLQILTTLGVGTAVPADALETLRGGLDCMIGERQGQGDLADWERIAWDHGYTYVRTPPQQAIADLVVDVIEVRRLLRKTQVPTDRSGFLGVSARLSALIADHLHSLGMFGPSWRWSRTARGAADESGDRDLRVWVRSREAFSAFHSERPASSVLALTDEAVEIAQGASSLGLVEAHKNRAYALVASGDGAGAREALEAMRNAFEGLPAPVTTDEDSLWGWPPRIVHLAESYVYTTMGAPEAAAAQRRALAMYPAEWRTDVAKLKLYQAITLIKDRDISGGLRHALASLNDSDGPRRTSVTHVAAQVLRALPDEHARALPAARELQVLTNG